MTLAAAGLLVGTVAPMTSAMADPAGNNGTVKIDALPFDDAPDNQPHVGCTFQVDWYGFDAGGVVSAVNFSLQPLTGTDQLLSDQVTLQDDPAGGGTDLDKSRTYDLSKAPWRVHPSAAAGIPRQADHHHADLQRCRGQAQGVLGSGLQPLPLLGDQLGRGLARRTSRSLLPDRRSHRWA
jgi:hypothetical protein